MTTRLRYVALGDSYTIGTAVPAADRWPDRLVAALGGPDGPLELVANLAVNGFTSADVIQLELPAIAELRPGFASLLIGVNDVVRGVHADLYRSNLATTLDRLGGLLPPERLLVVSTPDYTVTPAGADYGRPAVRRAAIVTFNAILAEEAATRGVVVVDIFEISARATTDRSLVAADGLHPSGGQYALWVERIAPVVESLLGA
jgi:lysophospholipase L1-like esterase